VPIERKEIAFGLNEFHDSFAVHVNPGQRYLFVGDTILSYLAETKQLENMDLSAPGKKEKIDWPLIMSKIVGCSTFHLIFI
jgi:hypothetical protein